jgi:hypothetical protein
MACPEGVGGTLKYARPKSVPGTGSIRGGVAAGGGVRTPWYGGYGRGGCGDGGYGGGGYGDGYGDDDGYGGGGYGDG